MLLVLKVLNNGAPTGHQPALRCRHPGRKVLAAERPGMGLPMGGEMGEIPFGV